MKIVSGGDRNIRPGACPPLAIDHSEVAVSAIPGTARAKNNSAALPIRDAGHGESW
jgi:hypothetical protein